MSLAAPVQPAPATPSRSRRARPGRTALAAHGEPLVWLFGGSLAIALLMIAGLLGFIVWQGARTFWPGPLVELTLVDGSKVLGETTRTEEYVPDETALAATSDAARDQITRNGGRSTRRLMRTGNFEMTGSHFRETPEILVATERLPEWGMVVEREEHGRFYGEPKAFLEDGEPRETDPEKIIARIEERHDEVRDLVARRQAINKHERGRLSRAVKDQQIALRQTELDAGIDSEPYRAQQERLADAEEREQVEGARLDEQVAELSAEIDRYAVAFTTASGEDKTIPLAQIVRAYSANRLGWFDKLGVYFSRWGEFLTTDPRGGNGEGGVFPAIFGTVTLTLIMCVAVVPFGVLAALYLREYAKGGAIVSAVRIAINNLAGVPSIVFGAFGLGFFCYLTGGGLIDPWLFEANTSLGDPTFGKPALIWASLTLALLTLPVVIVATEEALAAVPSSMREGSYACGASKFQTICRIVLPRALPGILTGMILAMSRGAGEVAPLMLVGAAKVAKELPVDGEPPFVHFERRFMHLGFHIYDLGFQSPDSEAAKPMVFTTTLLLAMIVATLNLSAIYLRAKLRKRFAGSTF